MEREQELSQKAKNSVPGLIDFVQGWSRIIFRDLFDRQPEINDRETLTQISLESLIFSVHLIDRLSFARMGPRERGVIVDVIGGEIRRSFEGSDSSIVLLLAWSDMHRIYGECVKIVPDEGESPDGTLFWEFAKKMTAYAPKFNPVPFMLINRALMGLYDAMADLADGFKAV